MGGVAPSSRGPGGVRSLATGGVPGFRTSGIRRDSTRRADSDSDGPAAGFAGLSVRAGGGCHRLSPPGRPGGRRARRHWRVPTEDRRVTSLTTASHAPHDRESRRGASDRRALTGPWAGGQGGRSGGSGGLAPQPDHVPNLEIDHVPLGLAPEPPGRCRSREALSPRAVGPGGRQSTARCPPGSPPPPPTLLPRGVCVCGRGEAADLEGTRSEPDHVSNFLIDHAPPARSCPHPRNGPCPPSPIMSPTSKLIISPSPIMSPTEFPIMSPNLTPRSARPSPTSPPCRAPSLWPAGLRNRLIWRARGLGVGQPL